MPRRYPTPRRRPSRNSSGCPRSRSSRTAGRRSPSASGPSFPTTSKWTILSAISTPSERFLGSSDEREGRNSTLREQRQVGLAPAPEQVEVDLAGEDPPGVRERRRLRAHLLCDEDAAAAGHRGVEPDPLQVAAQLLDRVHRRDALDLDGDPLVVAVATHQVDGPDVRGPFTPDEPELVLDRLRLRRELELEVAFDAVLLEPCRLPHVVPLVAQDLDEADLEPVPGAAGTLAHDEQVARLLDDGRRRHPVQRLVAARVRMDEHRSVVLHDQQPRGLGQVGREPAGVGDLAAGDDQTHRRRTVMAASDRSRTCRGAQCSRSKPFTHSGLQAGTSAADCLRNGPIEGGSRGWLWARRSGGNSSTGSSRKLDEISEPTRARSRCWACWDTP